MKVLGRFSRLPENTCSLCAGRGHCEKGPEGLSIVWLHVRQWRRSRLVSLFGHDRFIVFFSLSDAICQLCIQVDELQR